MHLDEFWEAGADWPAYFVDKKVWVYYDEYNAELIGDEDYCRIIVHSGDSDGLIYKRRLSDRPVLDEVLEKIERPVSERQLVDLGFRWWRGAYDDVQLDEMSRGASDTNREPGLPPRELTLEPCPNCFVEIECTSTPARIKSNRR